MTEQYIITFEELQELKPDVSEGMYKSTKEKNQEKIIFRVLGRTSKTMTDETISTLISENARIGAELKRATEMVELLSGERDRTIQLKENERVLEIIDLKAGRDFREELKDAIRLPQQGDYRGVTWMRNGRKND